MSGDDEGWTRSEWALWLVHHDEVDEAARVLEPGDELVLGRSDSLDLAAALARHGLSASHVDGRLSVLGPRDTEGRREERGASSLVTGARRPPLRAPGAPAAPLAAAKKTA